jgi:hypothetical protein
MLFTLSLSLMLATNSFSAEFFQFQANSTLYKCSKEEDDSDCEEESTNFPDVSIELVEDPDFGIKIGEWEENINSSIPTKISIIAIKIDEPEEDSVLGIFYSSNLANDSFNLEAVASSLFHLKQTPLELGLNSFGRKIENSIAKTLIDFSELKVEVKSGSEIKKQIKPSTRAIVSTFLKNRKSQQLLKRKKSPV